MKYDEFICVYLSVHVDVHFHRLLCTISKNKNDLIDRKAVLTMYFEWFFFLILQFVRNDINIRFEFKWKPNWILYCGNEIDDKLYHWKRKNIYPFCCHHRQTDQFNLLCNLMLLVSLISAIHSFALKLICFHLFSFRLICEPLWIALWLTGPDDSHISFIIILQKISFFFLFYKFTLKIITW